MSSKTTKIQSCVYLTIYTGNKLPMFYIGSTYLENITKNGYRGSVSSIKYKKIWKSELQNNPELFKTKIIKIYDTREEATFKENILHTKLNVIKSSMYINMVYALKSYVHLKKHVSEETKLKQYLIKKNKLWWSNEIESVFQETAPDESFKRGRKHFKNNGAKIGASLVRDMVWITNGTIETMIPSVDGLPVGFDYGRSPSKIKGIPKQTGKIKWFNNGIIEIMAEFPPDDSYRKGRLHGMKQTPREKGIFHWYNDGLIEIFRISQPNENFKPGRLKKSV